MIPESTSLKTDFLKSKGQIESDYRNIAEHINGIIKETTPTVSNTTVTSAELVYYRQNIMVDIWIYLTWSAVTGNIEIELPYYAKSLRNSIWQFPLSFSDTTLSAGYTGVVLVIEPNSNIATLYEIGSGQTMQAVTSSTGNIRGHIRYLGQEDK